MGPYAHTPNCDPDPPCMVESQMSEIQIDDTTGIHLYEGPETCQNAHADDSPVDSHHQLDRSHPSHRAGHLSLVI